MWSGLPMQRPHAVILFKKWRRQEWAPPDCQHRKVEKDDRIERFRQDMDPGSPTSSSTKEDKPDKNPRRDSHHDLIQRDSQVPQIWRSTRTDDGEDEWMVVRKLGRVIAGNQEQQNQEHKDATVCSHRQREAKKDEDAATSDTNGHRPICITRQKDTPNDRCHRCN